MKELGVFILWSGFGWLLLALGVHQRRYWQERTARERVRVTGEIVDYEEQRSVHRGGWIYSYYPFVRYSTGAGARCGKYDVSVDREKYPVGTAVEVLYDADAPEHFHLEAEAPGADVGRKAILISALWILVAALATYVVSGLANGDSLREILSRMFFGLGG